MRYPKWLVLITLIVTISCLAMILVFSDIEKSTILLYDIPLAVFGSSLLGFIMSLIMYYSEKRKGLEQFYLVALEILNSFYLLRPHDPTGSESELKKLLELYIKVSEIRIDNLRDAYGNLDFIVGNRKFRNNSCFSIYKTCSEIHKKLHCTCGYFKAFFEYPSMMEIAVDQLNEFGKEWFEKEREEDKEYIRYNVFCKYCDELDNSLELLRSKIYGVEPEYPERRAVQSGMYQKSLEKNEQ